VLKVSFTGAPEYLDRNVGYGEASTHIVRTFMKLGIQPLIKSDSADIGISFVQPDEYSFSPHQYKIGYTPWESTEFLPNWEKGIESCDEIWTTSQWCGEIFKAKTNKPVFVYEHGIEDSWIPKKRKIDESRPFRFLHVGEPAFRKDAQMVVDAFVSLYGNDPRYELILKCSNLNTTQVTDPISKRLKGSPNAFYDNIKIIESYISVEQMKGLYDLCDVFVYPSWGEGFGFNPLQAMASGIPTICTGGWASYERYITMPLNSTWHPSPWQEIHPGLMLKPSYFELKNYMEDVVKDYDYYSALAYRNSFLIHKDYNWEKISKPAIERLKEIQKSNF
jgi:glycosyltransferase involved in cell wall biosynthesis